MIDYALFCQELENWKSGNAPSSVAVSDVPEVEASFAEADSQEIETYEEDEVTPSVGTEIEAEAEELVEVEESVEEAESDPEPVSTESSEELPLDYDED